MTNTAGSAEDGTNLPLYEVRLQGHLDSRWADRLQGLSFTFEPDGTTTLAGPLIDQAALHGLLTRIRDLGVPIVSVRRTNNEGEQPTP